MEVCQYHFFHASPWPGNLLRMDKPNYARIGSASVLVVGLGLLAFMVSVEGEPGALPLGLIVLGTIGLVLTRRS